MPGVGDTYTLDSSGQAVPTNAPASGGGSDIPPSSAAGGLFGESLGAKIARGMLYVVPIVGQIAAGHERNVAAQRTQVNEMILTGALKSQDPSLLQHPEVMKATKALLGDKAPTFLGIASHIAQHQRDVHNGFIKLMLKHGYGQAGVDPKEVLRAAAAEATQSGIPIPPEVGSLIEQHLMKPAIGAATVEAERPGKVETARETATAGSQARENTRLNPQNVAGEAARTQVLTQAKEEATDPYIARRLADRIKAQADSADARFDRQTKERELLAEKHRLEKFGDARIPKATLDNTKFFDKDGTEIQFPPGSTFDMLNQLQAQGGYTQSNHWYNLHFGEPEKRAVVRPTQVPTGDPVNSYLQKWNH